MDAVVQFVRNALCTIKNFNALGGTFLYDPNVTLQYYAFPPPLDKTTPLEVLIAVTQFYAFVTISISGYKMITSSGVGKLQLINRLVNLRVLGVKEEDDNAKKKRKDGKGKDDDKCVAQASKLVTVSLLNESDAATRSFFVGVNVFAIGVAFLWLFANSFHVTETDWIGGVVGLIHALTIMEAALLVLLYYMVVDAGGAVRRSYRMREFANKVASARKLPDVGSVTVEQYSWLVDGWSPFWVNGGSESMATEERVLRKEEEAVASKLSSMSKKIGQGVADDILRQARQSLFEGYLEYLYLILNFLAFYGYLACIIVFYFPDESAQPSYVRAMLMSLPNGDADWLGNAVGDFAWTVEPLVILGSPMVAKLLSPKGRKEKIA